MSALIFLFAVAVIFGAILALEASESDLERARRPLGLIGWLSGGNWPAKIGGGLLVVGIGALLRFALINLDFPPAVKLGSGVCAAALLGLAATLTRIGRARRAVSLALGGAAFGVAYLTAYSAFGLFHYYSSPAGVALLALTALGAAVYAVTRSALSLGLLSMVGAYLAPAFAVSDPGPEVVYSYLAGASVLTLFMVAARGWRPLIHLSFLFTLGGGVFFAWTASYYTPQHADVMLPAVIVLAAVHLLMPVVERRGSASGSWIERLDFGYLLALPVAAGLAALAIAPSRAALSNELFALSAVWFAVALLLAALRRDGATVHAVIGILLAGAATAARFHEVPWELTGLAVCVLALWLAARRSNSQRLQSTLAGLVPVAGFFHILSSLTSAPLNPVFLNALFLERIIGACLLMAAAAICRSIRHSLDTLLWSVGIGWAVIATGIELQRLDLVSLPVLAHWAFLAAAAALALSKSRHRSIPDALVVVVLGVMFTALLASIHAALSIAWISMVAAPLALIWLSLRRAGVEAHTRVGRTLAAVMAPAVAWLWATRLSVLLAIKAQPFGLCAAEASALCLVILADVAASRCRDWRPTAVEVVSYVFAVPLALATTVAIDRSPWAVALELLCLGGLLLLVARERRDAPLPHWVAPACALGAGLVLQANLLRWFGPPGELTIADLAHMRFTALVSLLWATLGAVLTFWSRARESRPLWFAGSALMVAAAVKFVLLDFGALGQLANILAVIAAGIVFLLVGWLAPIPPAGRAPDDAAPTQGPQTAPSAPPVGPAAQPPPAQPHDAPRSSTPASPGSPPVEGGVNAYWQRNASHPTAAQARRPEQDNRTVWTVVILAVLVLPLATCGREAYETLQRILGTPAEVSTRTVNPVLQQTRPVPRAAATPAPDVRAIAASQKDAECSRWTSALPASYVVYSAGAFSPPPRAVAPGAMNPPPGIFRVRINVPGRDVVLLLGAYRPAVWVLLPQPGTHLAGVWASGYLPQRVVGAIAGTPILRTSFREQGPQCPWFAASSPGAPDGTVAALQVLHHPIDATFPAREGIVEIDDRSEAPDDVGQGVAGSVHDSSSAPAGESGITALVRVGLLRPVTTRDLEVWKNSTIAAELSNIRVLPQTQVLDRTYLVRGPLTLPAGLTGRSAVVLVLPRGMPRPKGDAGQSEILDMNPPALSN
jgi:Predicted membrane protein (DUF2339)